MIAAVDETDLANVIYEFGEERHSRRIARAIVAARARAPLTTTTQLADIVRRAQPGKGWQRIDPATRTFQALRIWVNRELDGLDEFLKLAAARLDSGARLAVIAFHSLEDRIVKHTFRALAGDDAFRIVTKRPLTASETELTANARARSAKLRVLERVTAGDGLRA
jgi:16S rRNA (cytosine1402-N4)-methyltransferase